MLMRIQAVLSPVGWGTCNSLCSQSSSYLSLPDCFYLFLYPLSLCLAPEQTAHHSLLCSANTKFKIQTLPSSFCRRQQMQFFSIVLQLQSDWTEPIKKRKTSSEERKPDVSPILVFINFTSVCLSVWFQEELPLYKAQGSIQKCDLFILWGVGRFPWAGAGFSQLFLLSRMCSSLRSPFGKWKCRQLN